MLNIKIEAPLDEAIAEQAKREKKSKPELVRHALEKYLEDAADYRDAIAVKRRREKSTPFAEIKKQLGL